MTHEEILQLLYDDTLVGNAPAVKDGVNGGLQDGLEPERMLYDALIPSLEEVGARVERGDYFVPEMLIAARAMQGALDILRPLLAESDTQQVGTFLMGTVKGDVHDIGKNSATSCSRARGSRSSTSGSTSRPSGSWSRSTSTIRTSWASRRS
jgi:methanogenic corrinoid protein MtbC1